METTTDQLGGPGMPGLVQEEEPYDELECSSVDGEDDKEAKSVESDKYFYYLWNYLSIADSEMD